MTPLRKKMSEDLRLRGLSPNTQDQYVGCVRVYARYHGRSPALLGQEHVRDFLLHMQGLGRAKSTLVVYWCALKFVYAVTLGRPEVMKGVPRARVRRGEPGPALTTAEVSALLDAAGRNYDRTLLSLMYACGFRATETCTLQAQDIDAPAGLIHIRHGKGDKARSVRLSPRVLAMLRVHWREHKLAGPWLFPAPRWAAPYIIDAERPWRDQPVSAKAMAHRFRRLRIRAALRRPATMHDLRRAYGTHLHEVGVRLRTLQVLLGHNLPETTARYTSVSAELIRQTPCPLDLLE